MRTRKIRVPSTTNNITKGIINLLNANGYVANRIDNVGIYDFERKVFRRKAKNELGIFDVVACTPRGFYLGIEIKNEETKDRMSPEQIEFHKRVKNANGTVLIIRSYPEFVEWYNKFGVYL